MTRRLTVDLGERSYPILLGPGLLAREKPWQSLLRGKQIVLISDSNVAPLYAAKLIDTLSGLGVHTLSITLAAGETSKGPQTLHSIYRAMLKAHCDRSTTVIALGGGVVGDVAGFAAATYQRGVDYVQVPTTLVGQVDSAVGGKTGINHPLGKNMIGAFWQPRLVLTDTDTLRTLPPREFSAGLAEVVKYALIVDASFLDWLEQHLPALQRQEGDVLAQCILRCCAIKARIVGQDEKESGVRALLNLGHTFGHAIETGMGYGRWLHGEAIAAGQVMALELSRRAGWVSAADCARVRKLLTRMKLPITGPAWPASRYLALMRQDKKNVAGRLRLILLRHVGDARVVADVPTADIAAAIAACC